MKKKIALIGYGDFGKRIADAVPMLPLVEVGVLPVLQFSILP